MLSLSRQNELRRQHSGTVVASIVCARPWAQSAVPQGSKVCPETKDNRQLWTAEKAKISLPKDEQYQVDSPQLISIQAVSMKTIPILVSHCAHSEAHPGPALDTF